MKVMDKSAILVLIMIMKILKIMFYTQTQSYGPPAGGESLEERRMREVIFLAVQDSSITDIVCLSLGPLVGLSQLTIRA